MAEDAGEPRYSWAGPPRVDLWREEVTRGSRTWAQHRLVLQDGRAGAVAVVVHDAQLLLVRQWRPVVGQELWELPRGMGDATDDDAAATARREVLEETGLEALRTRTLGTVWPDSGVLANAVVVVEVEVDDPRPGHGRDGEVDDVRWVEERDLDHMIRAGELVDGLSLAALTVWRTHR